MVARSSDLLHIVAKAPPGPSTCHPAAIVGQTVYVMARKTDPDFGEIEAVEPASAHGVADLVMRLSRAGIERGLGDMADAFGMAPSAKRALAMLYRTCDVREAAHRLGIGYETMREQIEAARKAVAAPTLQRLLTFSIVSVALGTGRGGETDRVFQQIFDLTERQTRLAGLVANGSTRPEAAGLLGISDAVAKVELSALFAATACSSSIELARLLAETRALVALTSEEEFAETYPAPTSRTRLFRTADGRAVAVSDYGPHSGRPAIVMHSSMTTRPVNRALVETLQNSGFRPISIDRPGFGDSDPATDDGSRSYFELAADDMAFICDEMALPTVHVITRGAAQAATAFHLRHGHRIARMVIMNPDPDMRSSHRTKGIMPTLKQNFVRRPWAIAGMARVFAGLSSYGRIADNLVRVSAECPADADVMALTANKVDYYRGVSAMRAGRIAGFVAEQVGMATIDPPPPRTGTNNITLLIGDHDFIHDPADTIAYWRTALPDARLVVIEGGGRFIAYSHAAEAVAELDRG